MVTENNAKTGNEGEQAFSAPAISLPKGGGAIRGMGEKFAANPVTGTGSMTVPIATSPGRSGFGPQLALSYDSAAGNGPFGFGWNLSLPAITRKTDKGLPKYQDAADFDVFILSGAEDLVPVLVQDESDETWHREELPFRIVGGNTYRIDRYRPRIEGLFARIERWTNTAAPEDTFWRSISRDNITTWYGRSGNSRIADPADPTRIFSWLICQSHDDKGNVMVYRYRKENSADVAVSTAVSTPQERNRTDQTRSANRYLKYIRYGNHTPYFPHLSETEPWPLPPGATAEDGSADWFFEVVFDYGEHDSEAPTPTASGQWPCRCDPFSSYRAGFEVRTYRLCQRVLMFHHFPQEEIRGNCLVRSTDFNYHYEDEPTDARNPIYSFLTSITHTGYKRRDMDSYQSRSLPPLAFEYTQPMVQETVEVVDSESLENLPQGLDGATYRWLDLDGEGISGILTEQADGWFYKPNLSPTNEIREDGSDAARARFGPLQRVARKPAPDLAAGSARFMDLAGDGQLDLVELDGPTPGFYECDRDEAWAPHRAFENLPNIPWNDPNLRLVDLNGDGHADVLITEHDALVWYPSLAEGGFGPAQRIAKPSDEEKGPHLIFADATHSVYLADMSGDGLTDLVRICNGEVCYWPNLGYGRFGAKVTMDRSPWLAVPDQFDQRRIRLADIDGSGTNDIIYIGRDGVRLYFNQSGNGWSQPYALKSFPRSDNMSSITAVDLLANGTACLVWSSSLPDDARAPMRYIDLMGGQKPHLLVAVKNNLGAETRVHYAPSTRFYLKDKQAGTPWITRLPFPVHVVERVETYDRISRNRFVARYAYHHGYFDGVEREFRGFGMVEQWDTEEIGKIAPEEVESTDTNLDEASFVPPVYTKTWFHTGIHMGRNKVSNYFAGLLDGRDKGEYYREPAWLEDDDEAKLYLLDDTVLPDDLPPDEAREACRALKGSMLRQEVFAIDGTGTSDYPHGHPYTVTEQNFTIRTLQPRGGNRHAVFFTHPREAINFHYERNPEDPRVSHAMTLEVDDIGNVLKQAAIGYGRRHPSDDPLFTDDDRAKQTQTVVTYTENVVTESITDPVVYPDDYRTPLPCETRTYELTGYTPTSQAGRFGSSDFVQPGSEDDNEPRLILLYDDEVNYEDPPTGGRLRRLIEHLRTLFRPDDLGVFVDDPLALLPLGVLEPFALVGETYKLAFTPGLLDQAYQRPQEGQPPESLLPDTDRTAVLGGTTGDEGGYVDLDGDGHWWIPSGRVFYSPNSGDGAAAELAYAQQHFFLPHRYRDPFGETATVEYDTHDLLIVHTVDPFENTVTAENDYRVLQPRLLTDPNGNQAEGAFDALGMVAGTAVMGKGGETQVEGDSLEHFNPDLTDDDIRNFLIAPRDSAVDLLGSATTRIIYNLHCYENDNQPVYAATLAREIHLSDLPGDQDSPIQISFTYSDGFGREVQTKVQAEPGDAPLRQPSDNPTLPGPLVIDPETGKPAQAHTATRWVGTGRTIYNNKGKPVKKYEPFFSSTHLFETEPEMVETGVTPILFYDPLTRVVATLHPNHTYEKVVFDPWQQKSYDVNDTVLQADPARDENVGIFFSRLPEEDYRPTWHALRTDSAHLDEAIKKWPNRLRRNWETDAAEKAQAHDNTPTIAHFDALGRPFLTIADNGTDAEGIEQKYPTRVDLDIEGNQRQVIDARDRSVMVYDYDMLGHRIHLTSMDAGDRWMLNDVAGKPIHAWDSCGHNFSTHYDNLRRPVRHFVQGIDVDHSDPRTLAEPILYEQICYGEAFDEGDRDVAIARNLLTRVWRQYDSSGVVTSEAYDFKGNLLCSRRQLAADYKEIPNWDAYPDLENEIFESRTSYDALNRPIQQVTPQHVMEEDSPVIENPVRPNVIQPVYNEANLLNSIAVWLRYEGTLDRVLDPGTADQQMVTNIDYDAKGQRELIQYENGVETRYSYDPETFRLIHMYTRRNDRFTDDCGGEQDPYPAPEEPPQDRPCGLQNLHYAYDPAGNITHIRDDAQQTIFFDNRVVEPHAEYTYDAIYRLIRASGREHLGQTNGTLNPPRRIDHNDSFRMGHPLPNERGAMGTYEQLYRYDEVGNILYMRHRGTDPAHKGWKRCYQYAVDSNRLLSTSRPGEPHDPDDPCSPPYADAPVYRERYAYDLHGNMIDMPHLSLMTWDFKDQLACSQRQVVNPENGVGERTYYVYDAGGKRVRKVTEGDAGLGETPRRMKERIYLGGLEIFRKYEGNRESPDLERQRLHIMDDRQRIALVETKTWDNGRLVREPAPLIRFQLSNHLGSSSLEVTDDAEVITYEEYYPYGGTSYQAVRSDIELSGKRYRYTGMERDEETGLNYHTARYYAPWLGRWCSIDPIILVNSVNLYWYSNNNPINLNDKSGKCSTDDPDCLISGSRPPHATPEDIDDPDESIPENEVEDALNADIDVVTERGAPTGEQGEEEPDIVQRLRRDRIVILERAGGAVIGIMVGFVDFFTAELYSEHILPALYREGEMEAIQQTGTFEIARIGSEVVTGAVFFFGYGLPQVVPRIAGLMSRISASGRIVRLGTGASQFVARRLGQQTLHVARGLSDAIRAYRQINRSVRATVAVSRFALDYIVGDVGSAIEDALTEVIREELGNDFAIIFEGYNSFRNQTDDYLSPLESYVQRHGLNISRDVLMGVVEFLHDYVQEIAYQD